MFVSHLCVFFGEMSILFFGPFFDWVVYFSGIELQELLQADSLPSELLGKFLKVCFLPFGTSCNFLLGDGCDVLSKRNCG